MPPIQQLIATATLLNGAAITTPGPTPASMPVTSLLSYQPADVGRFLDLTQTEFTWDLTAPLAAFPFHGFTTYRYIIILGSSITSAGTVEVFTGASLGAVASAGTAALHVAPRPFWLTVENNRNRFPVRHTFVDLGSQRTEPFCRVVFSDPTNPEGFLDVGTAFPSPGYVPSNGILSLPLLGAQSVDGGVVTPGGSRHTRPMPVFRTREITLQIMATNGANPQIETIDNAVSLQELLGLSEPFACITDLAPTRDYMDKFVYGTFSSLQSIQYPESFGGSQIKINYQELR